MAGPTSLVPEVLAAGNGAAWGRGGAAWGGGIGDGVQAPLSPFRRSAASAPTSSSTVSRREINPPDDFAAPQRHDREQRGRRDRDKASTAETVERHRGDTGETLGRHRGDTGETQGETQGRHREDTREIRAVVELLVVIGASTYVCIHGAMLPSSLNGGWLLNLKETVHLPNM